jgi:hypothetical protein
MASRVASSKVKGKPLKVMWGRIQEVLGSYFQKSLG